MKNILNLLAIDLGSNLGWARLVCTVRPELKIVVADKGTIFLDSLVNERLRVDYNEILTRSRLKKIILEEQLRKLIEGYKYDIYTVEDVFADPNSFSAFKSLVVMMDTLERLINIEQQKRLYTIPTKVAKLLITGHGGADKDQVQQAILNHPNISIKKLGNLTEHEADAIAVGHALISSCISAGIS